MTIADGQSIGVNGQLTLNGSTVVFDKNVNNNTDGIVVNSGGTLAVTGSTFSRSNGYNENARIEISAGAYFTSGASTYTIDNLYLDAGSLLHSGDLTTNIFNTPFTTPISDVPLLTDNQSFYSVSVTGALASGQTMELDPLGTQTTVNQYYVFVSNGVVVPSGTSLTIGTGAAADIVDGVTVSVGGQLTIDGATVVLQKNVNNNTDGIVVNSGGTLAVTGSAFSRSGGYNENTRIEISAGAYFTSGAGTYTIDNLYLDAGSLLYSGDLTTNIFNTPFTTPISDVPLLTDNQSFYSVSVTGSLAGGQTMELDPLGTQTTVNQYHVFVSNGVVVPSGTSLTIGTGAAADIVDGVTVSVGGQLTIDGATVVLQKNVNNNTDGIVVNSGGTMAVTGSAFSRSGGYNENTRIEISAGAYFTSGAGTYTIDNLYLDAGSLLHSGDLTTNIVNTPLTVPITDVPLLTNNQSFYSVSVTGALASGQTMELDPLGTQTTVNQYYVFVSNGVVVPSGTSLTIGTGAAADIVDGVTVSVGGQLTLNGATVVFKKNVNNNTDGIVVNSGGTMAVTGSAFSRSGGYNENARIEISAGAYFTSGAGTYTIDNLYLDAGSLLYSGDLTTNIVNTPLTVPITDVPLLTDNQSFYSVSVAGALASGQTMALDPLGTQTTANQYYVFVSNGVVVPSGTSLTIGTGAVVYISDGVTVGVSGQLSVSSATVVIDKNVNNNTDGIVVNSGGTMTVTGSAFSRSGGYNENAHLEIGSNGQLTATGTSVSLDNLYLDSGSNDQLTSDVLATQLQVNSGAFIAITGNDFSNATVVASGTSTATINLSNNFWGTTSSTVIAGKITDHHTNSNLPTVLYAPYQSAPPADLGSIQGIVFNDINGNGVQDSGEPGIAGVVVYIDANDNGVLDSGELSTVTDAADPTALVNPAGDFSFPGLSPGTYVVREQVPAGSVQTSPSATSVTNTINFDNLGGGVTSFTSQSASFSGGTTFAASQSALLASTPLAYNATSGSAQVNFSLPISSVTFYYVSGDGFAAGTATAFGPDGSTLGSVNSNAVTTYDDPKNFVTMSFAEPIAGITFSGGVIDNFSFTTEANDQAMFVHVGAGQTVSGIALGQQSTVTSTDLVATSVTPTTTGFTAAFNQPLNASVLNLYDTGSMGPADATLVGQSVGSVTGSMVVSPDGQTITFISTAGLLAPDTYTITLVSGAKAFVDTNGDLLDGNGDGTPGDNLTSTFTVSPLPSNAEVVSIPDFTRGFGQPVNVPASSSSGLPINISDGTNVTGVDLTLEYNPDLLTLSGFTTTIAGASAVFNVTTPGTAILTISSATPFSTTSGPITLGDLTASVPDAAPYGDKEILQITNLSVFDDEATPQPLPAIAQDAIHIAAYFGDTNADQTYDTPDVTLEQRYIGLINDGFPAFPLADPVLIGDITLNGQIQANDTTSIQRAIGLVNVPNIPPLPTGIPPAPSGGPDPTIFVPDEHAVPGQTVTLPVEMTVTDPAGITVSGFQVAIAYDPSVFTASNVAQLGSMFSASSGFSGLITFPKPGELIFQASSPTGTGTIANNTTTDLFNLTFTTNPTATNGSSVIKVMQNIQTTTTAIFDNKLDRLTLSPAPVNGTTDSVVGTVAIGASPTTTAAAGAAVSFSTAGQTVSLTATIASGSGTVNEGTETFTVLNGTTPVGNPVIVNVVNGSADASYALPAGTPAGTYVIQAAYNGTVNFGGSRDTSRTLIINAPVSAGTGTSATPTAGSPSVPPAVPIVVTTGTVDAPATSTHKHHIRIVHRSEKGRAHKGPGSRLHRFATGSLERRLRESRREVHAFGSRESSTARTSPSS